MTDHSHSFLPAARVADACTETLYGIRDARGQIMESLLAAERSRRPWWSRWILRTEGSHLLTPGEQAIYHEHRKEDERRVSELRDLARATRDLGQGLCIMVTVQDFQLLKPHWEKTG